LDAPVLLLEDEPVDNLPRQQVRVPMVDDADLAQHLPDDGLDVLVVDVDILAAVHALDLADHVLLHRAHPAHGQDLLRVERAFRQAVARADLHALLDTQVASVRHQVSPADDDRLHLVPPQ